MRLIHTRLLNMTLLCLSISLSGQVSVDDVKNQEKTPSEDQGKPIVPSAALSDTPVKQAQSLVGKGSLDAAEQVIRQHLSAHPTSSEGHFLLGLILFKKNNPKESLSEFTEGAKHNGPSAFDLKIVALNYVLLGAYGDADRWLTRSLERNPQDAQAWYYLGRTKYSENRFEEAIGAFQQCLKLDPANVKAEDNLGLSYQGLGKTNEALTAFQTAIAWQGEKLNPWPMINLGGLLLDQNRTEEAIKYLSHAVEISPREPKAHEQLGKAYSRRDDLVKAQEELEKAVALSPESAPLHFMLGQLYRKRGMTEKAKSELERGAALNAAREQHNSPLPPE